MELPHSLQIDESKLNIFIKNFLLLTLLVDKLITSILSFKIFKLNNQDAKNLYGSSSIMMLLVNRSCNTFGLHRTFKLNN